MKPKKKPQKPKSKTGKRPGGRHLFDGKNPEIVLQKLEHVIDIIYGARLSTIFLPRGVRLSSGSVAI